MLKLLRYMKKNIGYMIVIIGLLFVQAYTDLSLPAYTSKIVDTGIQQHGIENAAIETIRSDTMEELLLLMDEKERQAVQDAYDLEEGLYIRKNLTQEQADKTAAALSPAMVLLQGFEDKGLKPSELPQEQLQALLPQMKEQLSSMAESLVLQGAVRSAAGEYEAQGFNLEKLQTRYLLSTGLRMLGLAGVGMLWYAGGCNDHIFIQ